MARIDVSTGTTPFVDRFVDAGRRATASG